MKWNELVPLASDPTLPLPNANTHDITGTFIIRPRVALNSVVNSVKKGFSDSYLNGIERDITGNHQAEGLLI